MLDIERLEGHDTRMGIDSYEDIIDVRDIIEAVEDPDTDVDVVDTLHELLEELKGYGGDHQWQGDWYPVTLVRDSYFVEYAQDLADGIYDLSSYSWPASCIDWQKAARELQMDYTSVEYNGVTYWYR